jgi:putative transposase
MHEAEMDEHLSYEKHSAECVEAAITVPRERNSSYEPQAVEKRQTRTEDIENRILAMYAKGMSTRDIEDHLRDIYGIEVSSSQITDKVMPLVTEWQNRPLDAV